MAGEKENNGIIDFDRACEHLQAVIEQTLIDHAVSGFVGRRGSVGDFRNREAKFAQFCRDSHRIGDSSRQLPLRIEVLIPIDSDDKGAFGSVSCRGIQTQDDSCQEPNNNP